MFSYVFVFFVDQSRLHLKTRKCAMCEILVPVRDMETKTFCSRCPTHCYAAKQREAIRNVMRYSGPRMLLHHPVLTIKHGLDTLRARVAE